MAYDGMRSPQPVEMACAEEIVRGIDLIIFLIIFRSDMAARIGESGEASAKRLRRGYGVEDRACQWRIGEDRERCNYENNRASAYCHGNFARLKPNLRMFVH
jgi:hypothetical protein